MWHPIKDLEKSILVLAAKYIYNEEPSEEIKWEKVARLVQTNMEADCKFEYPYEADGAKESYTYLEESNHDCVRKWDGVAAGDMKVIEARKLYGILDLGAMGLPG